MCRLHRIWGMTLLLSLTGQVALAQPRPIPPIPPANCLNGRPFVVLANGVSPQTDIQLNLGNVYENWYVRKPIVVEIPWTRPFCSNSSNFRDLEAHALGATRMVCEIQRIRRCNPDSPIVITGYCAGSHVALLAAEQLPPGCVDRIVLLSPGVSTCYDVRCAMRASRLGMDVYYNTDDTILDFYEEEVGTADGRRTAIAGRIGFLSGKLGNDPLLCNLRQSNVKCLDVGGGHFATSSEYFLCRYFGPLLPCGRLMGPLPSFPPPGFPGPPGPGGPPGPPNLPPPQNTQGMLPPLAPEPFGPPPPLGPGPTSPLPPALPRIPPAVQGPPAPAFPIAPPEPVPAR